MVMTYDALDKYVSKIIHIDSEKNGYGSDYIFHIRYKYPHEKEWTEENILLEFEGFDKGTDESYAWSYDWNEGQSLCEVLGFIRIENVDVPPLPSTTTSTS